MYQNKYRKGPDSFSGCSLLAILYEFQYYVTSVTSTGLFNSFEDYIFSVKVVTPKRHIILYPRSFGRYWKKKWFQLILSCGFSFSDSADILSADTSLFVPLGGLSPLATWSEQVATWSTGDRWLGKKHCHVIGQLEVTKVKV